MAQRWQHLGHEPGVPFFPAHGSPGWVRQGEEFWVGGEAADPIRHGAGAEISGLGVAADEEREFDLRQKTEEFFVPFGGAFRAGRGVAAIW